MLKKVLTSVTVLLLFLGFYTVVETEAYDPGYYITDYKINVVVREDGVYEIEEDIDVVFTMSSRGIYRYLPTHYSMNWEVNGNTYYRTYDFPISDIKVRGHETDIDYRDYDVAIRIGDPDRYLTGEQHYNIKYKIHSTALDVPEMGDMFYLNLIGSEWDTTIASVEIKITFPKAVDFSSWTVTSGAKGSISNEHLSCEVFTDGLSMHCLSTAGLEANQSITISQHLGETYFKFPSFSIAYIASGIGGVGILLITAFLFLRHGKDNKVIQTVEFSAPPGLNSASVGYIIDNTVHTRDVVSLLLEWAKDRYITIKEDDKDLTLTKIKDLDGSHRTYEKHMFEKVFRDNNEVQIKSLQYKFANEIDRAKMGVKKEFEQGEKRLYTAVSKGYKTLVVALAGIPTAVTVAISVYSKSYRLGMALAIALGTYLVATVVAGLLIYGLRNSRGKRFNFTYLLLGVIFFANFGLVFLGFVISGIANNMSIYLIASLLLYVAMIIMGIFMDKRTEYGNRVYGQVLGLKDFIKTAEEDRLKVLAKENPYIFYDILPYAYAFDMTDVWANHFKNLDVPEPYFYTSTSDVLFTPRFFVGSINSSMSRASTTMTSVKPSTTSSGGGSFGGGGSSGGGFSGGSSGGGFGGGGGGRW